MILTRKKGLILPRKPGLRSQDVFQSRTRTGTGASAPQSVGFRPDLVWSKTRASAVSHYLYDTDGGANQRLNTETTAARAALSQSLTSFDAAGYTLGTASVVNASGTAFIDWLFKEYPGFFKKGVINHTNGTADTVNLSSLGTVGMVVVKRTSNTGNWFTWHRSLAAGNNILLNSTAAQTTTNAFISVSGTNAIFSADAATGTYEYYAFAHQPSGIIQCGTVNVLANTDVAVDLGWDVQWLLIKSNSAVNAWRILDLARGFNTTGGQALSPNDTTAETNITIYKTQTNGFVVRQTADGTVIYIAIKKAA